MKNNTSLLRACFIFYLILLIIIKTGKSYKSFNGVPIMKISYLDLFNPDIHFFGKLCENSHDHKNGMSIRYKNGEKLGNCLQCRTERLYKKNFHKFLKAINDKIAVYKKKPENILNIDYLAMFNPEYHVFGDICVNGHNHKNGKSIRYINPNRTGQCLQCTWEKNNNFDNKEKIRFYDQKPEVKDRKRLHKKKPEVIERRAILGRQHYHNNPFIRLNDNFKNQIYRSIRDNKGGRHWETLVDFTFEEYLTHLQNLLPSNKTINDLGYNFQVDHIIPKSLFNFSSYADYEFKLCWSLKNLQPLEGFKNQSKNDRYIGSPDTIIMTSKEFLELKDLFPLKLLCNCIWNEYYSLLKKETAVKTKLSEEHWKDMPEFIQEKKLPYAKIIVRFETEEDLNEFASLVNQKLNNKTKSIWFPFKSHFHTDKKEWTDEPTISDIHSI